jgi:hypothetical protein
VQGVNVSVHGDCVGCEQFGMWRQGSKVLYVMEDGKRVLEVRFGERREKLLHLVVKPFEKISAKLPTQDTTVK